MCIPISADHTAAQRVRFHCRHCRFRFGGTLFALAPQHKKPHARTRIASYTQKNTLYVNTKARTWAHRNATHTNTKYLHTQTHSHWLCQKKRHITPDNLMINPIVALVDGVRAERIGARFCNTLYLSIMMRLRLSLPKHCMRCYSSTECTDSQPANGA